jgi:hypothetical protein
MVCLYPLARIAYVHTTAVDVRELSLAWHWFWLLWCGYVSVTNQVCLVLTSGLHSHSIFTDTQVVAHILWSASIRSHTATYAHHSTSRTSQTASRVTSRSELLHHDRLVESVARWHRLLAKSGTMHHGAHRLAAAAENVCMVRACRFTASIGRHEMGDNRQSKVNTLRPSAHGRQ